GLTLTLRVHTVENISYVDSLCGCVALAAVTTTRERTSETVPLAAHPAVLAPMPGVVGRVVVEVGQQVVAGDLLLSLEAMKLEHPGHAPGTGVVAALHVAPGAQVEAGATLAILDVHDARAVRHEEREA